MSVGEDRVSLRAEIGSAGSIARPSIELILAMPRPKALSRVLQTAAASLLSQLALLRRIG